jgi:beta-lactamase superfamily II metal-dependent hydrolase
MASAFEPKIIFLDAGQGDATLIIRPDGKKILVDCGAIFNKAVASDSMDLVFQNQGVYSGLHALVLTHPDQDHYSLVAELLLKRNVKIDHIFFGGTADEYCAKSYNIADWLTKKAGGNYCSLGSKPYFSNTPDKTLSSSDGSLVVYIVAANKCGADKSKKSNENSIVLCVYCNGAVFMLMADSTTATEKWIIEQDKLQGSTLSTLFNSSKIRVLKVGHHGSDTSTSDAWLNFFKPTVAVVSSDTQEFNGQCTCSKTVLDRVLNVLQSNKYPDHSYLQYDKTPSIESHSSPTTTKMLFTTLNKVTFSGQVNNNNQREFQADGSSIYYDLAKHFIDRDQGTAFYSKDYKK